MSQVECVNNRCFLTLVFTSLFLASVIILPHNAFAMGNTPSTCPNRYDGTIVSFIINNGSQTFDARANPGLTFDENSESRYSVTFVIHTPSTSSQNNTNSGTTWYESNYPGYYLGECAEGAGPNQNVTVGGSWARAATTESGTTQPVLVGAYLDGKNPVTFNVHWTVNSSPTTTSGDKVIATIPVGTLPDGVGVNPIRNMIYVTNHNDNTTSVIDGLTNTVVKTIPVGYALVTVNPITGKIYVDAGNNGIAVIDGDTDSVLGTIPVQVGNGAVNTNTNRIYEAAGCCGHDVISVIDGSNNTVTNTISVGAELSGMVSVNQNTNMIYATTICRGCGQDTSVVVIDGDANSVVANIRIPFAWQSLDVNPNTNTVYAAAGGNIYVINGSTNQIATTISGVITGMPSITVNPNTNKIYVSDLRNGVVSVIDGSTNNVENTISGFNQPYAIRVNPNTNMIYVANSGNNTVSVIQGSSIPSPPTELTATAKMPPQVGLSWTAPSNNGGSAVTGYMIERSTDDGTTWSTIVQNTGNTKTAYTDSHLMPVKIYTYRVSAINSIGTSLPSNTASARPLSAHGHP